MLYLTYDASSLHDGLGAQYQRIIGIIGLATRYNCAYVHTPPEKLAHGVTPATAEDFFGIAQAFPSVDSVTYDEVITTRCPSEEALQSYINIATSSEKNTLVRILFPYGIIEGWSSSRTLSEDYVREHRLPVYDLAMSLVRPLLSATCPLSFDTSKLNIAIHIRRGDVLQLNEEPRDKPASFYDDIIAKLKKRYSQPKRIHVYSQITEANRDEFTPWANDPEIQLHADEDVFLSLYHMIHADVLVTGCSSFSLVAGLYSTNPVFYVPYAHKPLPRWANIESL